MKIVQTFQIHQLIDKNSTCLVSEVFSRFETNPTDRRETELFGAVSFAKCLQLWHKQDLLISFVDEEKSQYKGIDFFLASTNSKKNHAAFQLIEFKAKYSTVNNTQEFAQWIIKKKFKKGDKKVNLLVTIATKNQLLLDIPLLRGLLKESPYLSIIFMGPQKNVDSGEVQYVLMGLNLFDSYVVVDLKNESVLECSGKCPYFKSSDKREFV